MVGEKGQKLRELADKVDEVERVEEEQRQIEEELNPKKWLEQQPLDNHDNLVKLFAEKNNLSLTSAKKDLNVQLKQYQIEGKDIPYLIKDMRIYRRTLKGEEKIRLTESIDNLIKAYSDHLDKSIDRIYWINKYKPLIKDMVCSESDLVKLSNIDDVETRRELIDKLCKYWEVKLERKDMPLNKEYVSLSKKMTSSKKEFKGLLRKQYTKLATKDKIKKFIVDSVCDNPGISSREIHESLPDRLKNKSSPSVVAHLAKSQNLTNVNGAFFKLNDEIKKDIYAYTAAFIDSDGYITMDKNKNPRVGLVATGDRGKAFMLEMHKSLGCGRLHLDQKSPQDTRPVNRLNFYSQDDVKALLTKCRPHFRMKGPNADILLELIRIKKGHKKEPWAETRLDELFKLMKYHNHKDDTNYDFTQHGFDLDSVKKLEGNNKMSRMDKIESLIKQDGNVHRQ
tara:strand:+ start:11257 stop:12612 length:1356 start_codon:yes stop_codon:yes gene_type:complete